MEYHLSINNEFPLTLNLFILPISLLESIFCLSNLSSYYHHLYATNSLSYLSNSKNRICKYIF